MICTIRATTVPMLLALTMPMLLAGCGAAKPLPSNALYNPQTNGLPPPMAKKSASSGLGTLFSFGQSSGPSTGTSIPVNAYLWRASLDTLSFMPLASANPFAGVIVTDWYAPPSTPYERFKATAYVLGKSLTAEDLKVSVFRQVLQNGGWTDAAVDPATVSGIEDRILARAAQLKGAGQQNG